MLSCWKSRCTQAMWMPWPLCGMEGTLTSSSTQHTLDTIAHKGKSNSLLSSQLPVCWMIVWLSADHNTATFSSTFCHIMQLFRWHHQVCIERTSSSHKSFVVQHSLAEFLCTFASSQTLSLSHHMGCKLQVLKI